MADKKYLIDNAELMAEWNWDKNTDLDPNTIKTGSHKQAWWKCTKGHEWQATIDHRSNGTGCPYCLGKKVLSGYNDLQTINPSLAKEWNYEKNNGLRPADVLPNSGKKVWWKCSHGHEWQVRVADRNKGRGCPYCSGRYAIKGVNDLLTANPTLAEEWDYEKNGDLLPEHFTANSSQKAWWRCTKGHEWRATIDNRSKGNGCPYCSGRYAIKGKNDLQTVNPTLAAEWNYGKNHELKPENVMPNSNKKVWWKCSQGHEWQATVASRNDGLGCPYCSGRYAIKGENDLQTVNPTLAKEWNYERNNGLLPIDVMPNSDKKVWWKCTKGHEWRAAISTRNHGNGCPVCSSERNTSFPEYVIAFYLERYGLDVIHSYKEKGYELDVYIPSKKIAIEYDGFFWHKDKRQQDLDKNAKCKKDGITLYRIREELPSLNDTSLDYTVQKSQKDLPIILKKVLSEIIGTDVVIDIVSDSIAIENLREFTEKENSLAFSNPEIANEWNYEKNGKLKPEHFAKNSGKKVWWRCSHGHEWQATIVSRNNGNRCPYCSNKIVLKGYNDLQTINPTLAKEWNYDKNGDLTPKDVLPNSGKKVWWVCSRGHEWQTSVANRSNGNNCPYCTNKKVLKGFNDFETWCKNNNFENLIEEFDVNKNDFSINDFTAGSRKEVWWICPKGHSYRTFLTHRTNMKTNCPYCSNKKVLSGFNDLLTTNPALAIEWNHEKNGSIKPEHFTANSGQKAWWKCSKGHEWQARIVDRNRGQGCPICYQTNRKKKKEV